jgi:hypothetical protein
VVNKRIFKESTVYTVLITALLLVIVVAGCKAMTKKNDPTPAAQTPTKTTVLSTTAKAVIADLRSHGFKVNRVAVTYDPVFGTKEAYDARINGTEAGIYAFDDHVAAQAWAKTSSDFDGIAVVGENWAISLDSDGSGGTSPETSRRLALSIANKLGGHAEMPVDGQ